MVAKTIAAQIGNMAFRMLGAKDLLSTENSLQFAIRGSRTANMIRVQLDPSDTYTVEFYKGVRKVKSVSGVYCDSLREVLQAHTGLYTSL